MASEPLTYDQQMQLKAEARAEKYGYPLPIPVPVTEETLEQPETPEGDH